MPAQNSQQPAGQAACWAAPDCPCTARRARAQNRVIGIFIVFAARLQAHASRRSSTHTPAVASSVTPVFTGWAAALAHAASSASISLARTRKDDVDCRSTISADTPGNDCRLQATQQAWHTPGLPGDWHPQTSGQSPASSPSLIRDSAPLGSIATVAAHWGAAGPCASIAARSTEQGVAGNRLDTTADTLGSKHHCSTTGKGKPGQQTGQRTSANPLLHCIMLPHVPLRQLGGSCAGLVVEVFGLACVPETSDACGVSFPERPASA